MANPQRPSPMTPSRYGQQNYNSPSPRGEESEAFLQTFKPRKQPAAAPAQRPENLSSSTALPPSVQDRPAQQTQSRVFNQPNGSSSFSQPAKRLSWQPSRQLSQQSFNGTERNKLPKLLAQQSSERSSQPLVEQQHASTSAGSAVIDLISDEERPRLSLPRSTFSSRFPPSSVVPGQTKPHTLPPNTTSCPMPGCPRHDHTYSKKKLIKHMIKRHRWPETFAEASDSPTQGASSKIRSASPRAQALEAFKTRAASSTVAQGQSNGDGHRTAHAQPPVPKREGEAKEETPSESRTGKLLARHESPEKTADVSKEQDLSDVPIVPGQLEPYTLPPGIRNCPLSQCDRHTFKFDAPWRVTEHMKRYHGWPRPSQIQQEWDMARASAKSPQDNGLPSTPLNASGKAMQLQQVAPAPTPRESAYTAEASKVPKENSANEQSRGTKRGIDGSVKVATRIPLNANISIYPEAANGPPQVVTETPKVHPQTVDGVSAKLRSMVPGYATPTPKTQQLYDAVSDAVRAAGRSQPWTSEEDTLIFHLKDDVRIKWKDMTPFFNYRGEWHVAQSRYSALFRKRKAEREQLEREQRQQQEPNTSLSDDPQKQPQAEKPIPDDEASFGVEESDYPIVPGLTAGTRRSARTTYQPGTFSKYFHLRPQENAESQNEAQAEAEADSPTPPPTLLQRTKQQHVERIPWHGQAHPYRDLWPGVERNDAAIASLTPRIARSPRRENLGRQHTPRKRRSLQVHKPYLSYSSRLFLHESASEDLWNYNEAREWQCQELHVDFTEAEAGSVKRAILRASSKFSKWQANPLGLDLSYASAADIDKLASEASQSDRFLNRSFDSVKSFLSDVAKGQVGSKPTIDRISLGREKSRSSLEQALRRRELTGNNRTRYSPTTWDSSTRLGPYRTFKGTSSDVNNVAWSPNGRYFAVGSAAFTDRMSMQYNRPNNLLFGDVERSRLLELSNHAVPRYADIGLNASSAMQATQDPLLFTTISDVQFSSDSKVLFSAGYDKHIRLWETGRYLRDSGSEIESTSNGLRCRWSLQKMSEVDLLAVAPQVAKAPGLFACATRSTSVTKPSIRIYNYRLDDDDTIDQVKAQQHLQSSRDSSGDARGHLNPSCLRFCRTPGLTNRYLLGGFTARDDAEERRGESCLWDVETGELLASFNKRTIFDVKWSPSIFGRFAIGCTAYNANRGTQTVVRLHDSRWLPSKRALAPRQMPTIELECPALDMNDVLFNPRHDHLVSAGCTDGVAYIWDLRNPSRVLHHLGHGDPLNELDHQRAREEADTGVRFLSWDQEGRSIYSGSSDGVVACWDPYRAPQNAFQREVTRMNSGIMAGSFSPDYTSLLLGDVEGSVLNLSVGFDDVSMPDCELYDFIPDDNTKAKLRARPDFKVQDASQDEDDDSGARIGDALISSGQIELKPYGDFPRRQAVQGPNYTGPFDEGSDAEDLRRAAHVFQARAQATLYSQDNLHGVGPQTARGAQELFTDNDVVDEGLWKSRIPARLHEAPHPEYAAWLPDSAGCSRCVGREVEAPLHDMVLDAIQSQRAADEVICRRCAAVWRADVLGHQLIEDGQSVFAAKPRHEQGAESPTQDELKSDDEGYDDDTDKSTHAVPLETMPHYLGLWQIDQLVLRSRF